MEFIMFGSIILFIIVFLLFLPLILSFLGLHPHYKKKSYDLTGKRALIITTSHSQLGEGGAATGVFSSEMTVPYYEFLDACMEVELASIKGGEIPIEPLGQSWPIATEADRRFKKDSVFINKVKNSFPISEVDFLSYDVIFLAGGWGAAFDLGQSVLLGEKLTRVAAEGKLIGAVCHGGLGLINIKDKNGAALLEGRNVTAVTNKQLAELGITKTPLHPETELRYIGAIFNSNSAFKDIFATMVVVDRNFVTGQNQNSGSETAQTLLSMLSAN